MNLQQAMSVASRKPDHGCWLGAGRLLAVALIAMGAYSGFCSAQTLDNARLLGLTWLVNNQRNDGSWGAKPESTIATTAVVLQAFKAAGLSPSKYSYASGTTWLLNAKPESIDSIARQIVSLAGAGAFINQDKLDALQNSANAYFGWGGYAGFDTSYPDTPLALGALRAYGVSYFFLRYTVYCEMLPSQLASGGWGYFNPRASAGPAGISSAALLPTVYNILELKAINAPPLAWDSNTCPGNVTTYSIVSAINRAKAFLLTMKNADGGFGPGGVSSVIETALVYLALRTLNPADADAAAALNFLLARQDASVTPTRGSWSADPFQTALVLSTFPTPAVPPNIVDTRDLAQGGGNKTVGLSVPSTFYAQATQSVAFSVNLSATGGTLPYSWAVAAGALPPGLSLAAGTGTISGVPSTIGSYFFTIAVTEARGTTLNYPGSMDVLAKPPASPLVSAPASPLLFLLFGDD